MNKKILLAVPVLAMTLVGCADANDPELLESRCQRGDMIFILDDPNKGSSLFVVPNHKDCVK